MIFLNEKKNIYFLEKSFVAASSPVRFTSQQQQ